MAAGLPLYKLAIRTATSEIDPFSAHCLCSSDLDPHSDFLRKISISWLIFARSLQLQAEICDHYGAGDPAAFVLSKQMSTAWVSFARTGNPNHNALPLWPHYTQESRAVMYFDAPCAVRNNPEGKGLEIIERSQPS